MAAKRPNSCRASRTHGTAPSGPATPSRRSRLEPIFPVTGPSWTPEVNAYCIQMQAVTGKWAKLYFADIIDAQVVWAFIVDSPTLPLWMTAWKVCRNLARRRYDWFLYRLMMAGL